MPDSSQEVTILFADVKGSTKLYETQGDKAANEIIDGCIRLMSEATADNGGRVIKTIGDEILAVFPSAEAGIRAGAAIQEKITTRTAQHVRVGIHAGPALLQDGDVFGDAVNVAARLVALAKADQVITSKQTIDGLPQALRLQSRFLGRTEVKGRREEVDLYEHLWKQEDEAELTVMVGRGSAPTFANLRLRLSHDGQVIHVDKERPSLQFGRSADVALTVRDSLASRQHGRIELNRGKFILSDESANGTFVLSDDGTKLYLHREATPLTGSGIICCGHEGTADMAEAIHFACET